VRPRALAHVEHGIGNRRLPAGNTGARKGRSERQALDGHAV
jgi:hypothetical protein